jgi:hypothetical protein
MNLDLLMCVIEVTPVDDLRLLHRLGGTCRSARKHAACAQAARRERLLLEVQKSHRATNQHADSKGARPPLWYPDSGTRDAAVNALLSESQRSIHAHLRVLDSPEALGRVRRL